MDLSRNLLNFIHFGAFDSLKSLHILLLSANLISALPKIDALERLSALDFSFNGNISRIDDSNYFVSNENLAYLNLSHCGFEKLSSHSLQPLKHSLTRIDVSHNDINDVRSAGLEPLEALREAYLGGNGIQVLKSGCFSTLRRLSKVDLSDSKSLIRIESKAFAMNSKLSQLVLDGSNKLASIDKGALVVQRDPDDDDDDVDGVAVSLKRIDGAKNIAENLLQKLSVANEVASLTLSPLNCDCKLMRLRRKLLERPKISNESQIICQTPDKVEGKSLTEIDEKDLSCSSSSLTSHYHEDEYELNDDGYESIMKDSVNSTTFANDVHKIALIVGCVIAALITGIFVVVFVHCRKKNCLASSNSSTSTASSSMGAESPLDQQLLCCDLTLSTTSTTKSRPIIRGRSQPSNHQIRTLLPQQQHHHHQPQQPYRFSGLDYHQRQQQQQQQPPLHPIYNHYTLQQHRSCTPASTNEEQSHHYAIPNVDGFPLQQQQQQQQQQRLSACLDFNTVNTRSSYCDDNADDEFVIAMRDVSKL